MSLLRQDPVGQVKLALVGTRAELTTVGKLSKDQFSDYLAFARQHGFKFDGEKKLWAIGRAKLRPETVEAAESAGYIMDSLPINTRHISSTWTPSPDPRCFPYQVEGIHWLHARTAAMCGDEMGLGKTQQALQAIDPAWPVLVVAPKAAKAAWPREAAMWAPWLKVTMIAKKSQARLPQAGEIVVLNYEQLGALDPTQVLDRTLIICDEFHMCFPAGTQVATQTGPVDIAQLKEGDMVRSYNSFTCAYEWKPVTNVWRNKLSDRRMVRITHAHGTLVCTENHKVWTEECGYVEAGNLSNHTVRVVRAADRCVSELHAGPVLQHELQRAVEKQATARARGGEKAWESAGNFAQGREITRVCGTDAEQQPHAHAGCSGAFGKCKTWPPLSDEARRERARAYRGASTAEFLARLPIQSGVCSDYSPYSGTDGSPAHMLQGGPGGSADQAGNRGGWDWTQKTIHETEGPEEGSRVVFARVESVEILERGNHDQLGCRVADDTVYDIEVADNHNYFAEGVLVSNCKAWKAQRTQNVRDLMYRCFEVGGRIWAFTGTPVLNRPQELWGVLQSMGSGRVVFPGGYEEFKVMCGGRDGKYGVEWNPYAICPSVSKRLERVMLRRTRKDVFSQMPPKIYTTEVVEIGDRKLLVEMEELMNKMGLSPGMSAEEVDQRMRGGVVFENFSRIRAAIAAAKIPAMVEKIELMEESCEPMVVVSAHRAPIDILKGRKGWAVITGDVSAEERGRIQDDFAAGKLKGVALTIRAGGVGISLTRASQMLFVDLDFSPGMNAQAEDRLRPHLQQRSCVYTTLVANSELDQMVTACLRSKQITIGNLLGEEYDRTYEAENEAAHA